MSYIQLRTPNGLVFANNTVTQTFGGGIVFVGIDEEYDPWPCETGPSGSPRDLSLLVPLELTIAKAKELMESSKQAHKFVKIDQSLSKTAIKISLDIFRVLNEGIRVEKVFWDWEDCSSWFEDTIDRNWMWFPKEGATKIVEAKECYDNVAHWGFCPTIQFKTPLGVLGIKV